MLAAVFASAYFERDHLIERILRQLGRDMLRKVRPPSGAVEAMADYHGTEVEETNADQNQRFSPLGGSRLRNSPRRNDSRFLSIGREGFRCCYIDR